MRKIIACILVLTVISSIFTGCTWFEKPEQEYKRYTADIRQLDKYKYTSEIHLKVDHDEIEALSNNEAFMPLLSKLQDLDLSINGVYNEPSKQLQASISANVNCTDNSVNEDSLTDIVLDGEDTYISLGNIYNLLSQLTNADETWPFEQQYYKGSNSESYFWSNIVGIRTDETPNFVTNIDNFLWEYINNNGSLASSKQDNTHSVTASIDNVKLDTFIEEFLNIIMENKAEIADYCEIKFPPKNEYSTYYKDTIDGIRYLGEKESFQQNISELRNLLHDNNINIRFSSTMSQEKISKNVYKYRIGFNFAMYRGEDSGADIITASYTLDIDPNAELAIDMPSEDNILSLYDSKDIFHKVADLLIDDSESNVENNNIEQIISDLPSNNDPSIIWSDDIPDEEKEPIDPAFVDQELDVKFTQVRSDKGDTFFAVIKDESDINSINIGHNDGDKWNYNDRVTTEQYTEDQSGYVSIHHAIIEFTDESGVTVDDSLAEQDANGAIAYAEENGYFYISEVGQLGDYYYVTYIINSNNILEVNLQMFRTISDNKRASIVVKSSVGVEPVKEFMEYVLLSNQ